MQGNGRKVTVKSVAAFVTMALVVFVAMDQTLPPRALPIRRGP
jgi:hypothetical protein